MEKRSREKIALVLLLFLLVAGVCFMGWYIVKGHNWNYAAASIDDTVGSMDGYVVVLYNGSDIPNDSSPTGIGIISSGSSSGEGITIGVKADGSEKPSAVDVGEEAESYRNKKANVFTLHTDIPGRYDEPSILYRSGYKIGVFSVESDTPYLAIDKSISYLKSHNVDLVIVLEDSENEYVREVDGVDIIVELGTTPKETSSSSVRNGTKEYSLTSDKTSSDSLADSDASSTESSAGSGGQSSNTENPYASSDDSFVGSDKSSASSSASSAVSSTGLASTGLASGASSTGLASTGLASGASSTGLASTGLASGASSNSSSSEKKTNNAMVVSRCDRGSVGAILISPNNVVSTKVISPE